MALYDMDVVDFGKEHLIHLTLPSLISALFSMMCIGRDYNKFRGI